MPWFRCNLSSGFQVYKAGFPVKGKVHFPWVQYMEDDDFVLSMPKVFKPREQFVRVIQEVGQNDNQTPALDPFSQVVEGVREIRVGARGLRITQRIEQGVKMASDGARRKVSLNLVVECDETDGVSLTQH